MNSEITYICVYIWGFLAFYVCFKGVLQLCILVYSYNFPPLIKKKLMGCVCLTGKEVPVYVWGLHAHLQHSRKPANTSEDTPWWIHLCVQPAGLRQSLSHLLQPKDPCSRPHKGETFRVWCAGLWEGFQHTLQVKLTSEKHKTLMFFLLCSCSFLTTRAVME